MGLLLFMQEFPPSGNNQTVEPLLVLGLMTSTSCQRKAMSEAQEWEHLTV